MSWKLTFAVMLGIAALLIGFFFPQLLDAIAENMPP